MPGSLERALFRTLLGVTGAALRFEEGDDLLALLGVSYARERLHIIIGHQCLRISDPLVQLVLGPRDLGVLQAVGVVGKALHRAGFPADDAVKARAEPIVVFFVRVTLAAMVVEREQASLRIIGEALSGADRKQRVSGQDRAAGTIPRAAHAEHGVSPFVS